MIVVMAGLPGSGKTTLARELAARTGGRVLDKDELRHCLFRTEEIEYSSPQDDFCLHVMLETAGYLLRHNRNRILFIDGRPFSRRYQLTNVINSAAAMHQPWRILECVCAESIAKERLESAAGSHLAANRNYELYLEVRSRFESIDLPKTVIDTNLPLQACVETALSALR